MFTSKNVIAVTILLLLSNCNDSKTDTSKETTLSKDSVTVTDTAKPAVQKDVEVTAQRNPTFVLVLVSEGIQAINAQNGSARTLAFNLDKQQVVTAVSNVLESSYTDSSVNVECGGLTILTWTNGLSLNFNKAPGKSSNELRFVGWSLNTADNVKSTLATMAGVGIGSTLKELESAYEVKKSKTTLGTEVSLGKITALLAKDAPNERVTNMWSGTNCLAR